jgi:hypothetical protein
MRTGWCFSVELLLVVEVEEDKRRAEAVEKKGRRTTRANASRMDDVVPGHLYMLASPRSFLPLPFLSLL